MPVKDYHKILGVSSGATEGQIKAAYRKLVMKYHPDLNQEPGAREKFFEIDAAYDFLMKHGSEVSARDSYDDSLAREVLRREREQMVQRARAKKAKQQREEEMFNRPEWHDPILLAKYIMHGFGLLFAFAAVIGPLLIAILDDPASLAGTFFFMVAGVVLLVYIYPRRKTWFRLGKFKTSWREVAGYVKMDAERPCKDRCCYCAHAMAGGKPYRVELILTLDSKIRTFGVMDHQVKYRTRTKRIVIPRSARAHFFHRIATLIKLTALAGFMLFFPVESMVWRFIGGMVAGGLLSTLMLSVSRIRSKVSYLLTPGLILKSLIWIAALLGITTIGPGFNMQTSGYIFAVIAGLLFLLDMLFDLVLGLFPFYRWMFRPFIRQGAIMDELYKEGYQNYQEFPVYSVVYPLFRWLF
ncbi:MAG: DnaJ domain-containing protein [Bacteroidales bacterium]